MCAWQVVGRVCKVKRKRHSKALVSPGARWALLLCLVPWLFLSATNGGKHSHAPSRASLSSLSAMGSEVYLAVAGNAEDSDCVACVWQLHSNTYPAAAPALVHAPARSSSPVVQTAILPSTQVHAFDPRGPPLV